MAWHYHQRTSFDQLEPRFAATIIYRGCTWKGRVMDCSVGGTNGAFMAYREQSYSYGKTTTGYFLRKLLDEKLIDVKGTKSSQAWVEIRFAEVLLNKAEAAYRLNKTTEAQSLMNRVRGRQGVNLPGKSSSGEAWFNDYRNERKIELAYEGHLFWDMRRWRLAHIEYNIITIAATVSRLRTVRTNTLIATDKIVSSHRSYTFYRCRLLK